MVETSDSARSHNWWKERQTRVHPPVSLVLFSAAARNNEPANRAWKRKWHHESPKTHSDRNWTPKFLRPSNGFRSQKAIMWLWKSKLKFGINVHLYSCRFTFVSAFGQIGWLWKRSFWDDVKKLSEDDSEGFCVGHWTGWSRAIGWDCVIIVGKVMKLWRLKVKVIDRHAVYGVPKGIVCLWRPSECSIFHKILFRIFWISLGTCK